ncbi:Lipoprotein-anchoring transpeptidase ErfK/SrfK [Cognatiyoonia koreensis]|uniref:Lipoprotein-anchoring transpeptidase ErfK/SrfK n=1 Tax=Cognatiyoonia koreensis TaxID=364200 RepID=A0A1I0QR84_9RHOB|nr:L,D-transpeptidase [Cognatiyoonia koreensis]SEW29773.1 Lipoprotein-anchoring transpeptidase ErfK/SrfK [Cognatiyoonia koreensis]
MPSNSNLSRRSFGALMLGGVAACGPRVPESNPISTPSISFLDEYGPIQDNGYNLPPIPAEYTQGINRRMEGTYLGEGAPGTIDVDPYAKFLYHVKFDGTAVRYPVGVGRQGRSIRGRATVRLKKEWPGWTPTANMLRREPEVYEQFRSGIPGGLASPLGSRALYLYRNGRDTYYRIHGTNDLESIGNSGSAGCIRMFNQDIIHLYNQVDIPTEVIIRSPEESLRIDPEYYERGVELPPKILSREELLNGAQSWDELDRLAREDLAQAAGVANRGPLVGGN